MIIIGLASVIIGESIFGKGSLVKITFAVILGAVIYALSLPRHSVLISFKLATYV